nr:hypothetical protein BaRGS_025405 [Batillaria attramentaria]
MNLNFRTLERVEEMEKNHPRDRFNLVYLIMVVHGIGILMPWNMFINAKAYFEDHKLNQGNETTAEVQEYSTNFMSYIGMAAQFPNALMNLVKPLLSVWNFSGTFVACINILAIALAPDIRTSAIYYFVTAIVVLLIAFDAYFILPLSIWVLALSVWFVFFVSLALFPQIQSDVKSLHFPIHEHYWPAVFCFLNFNLFAMLGNLITEWLRVVSFRMVPHGLHY